VNASSSNLPVCRGGFQFSAGTLRDEDLTLYFMVLIARKNAPEDDRLPHEATRITFIQKAMI